MKRDGYEHGFESSDLFARDGHLTMLTLDRFDAGELPVAGCEEVIDHLRGCVVCSDRVETMRHDVSLLPPPGLGEPRPNTVVIGTLAIGATVAAAAALLLLVWPQPQQASRQPAGEGVLTASPYTTTTAELDGFSSAAGNVDVRVLAGSGSEPLRGRERVPWEEPIAIEVSPREAGFVAVLVATDPAEEDIDGTGGIELLPEVQVLMPATRLDALRTIDYRVDGVDVALSAEERVIVVSCPERFRVSEFDPDVPAPDGCTTWELGLLRYTEMADS
jgi:hypothetical protein